MYLNVRIAVTSAVVFFLGLSCTTSATAGPAGEAILSKTLLESVKNRAQSIVQDQITGIPELDRSPDINGMLQEEIWEQAVVWKLPWEINRGENRAAEDETYVLMAIHRSNFLIAFINMDGNPDRIRATLTDRNNWSLNSDDAVGFFLDPFGDGLNAYVVMINAAGVQADAMRLDRGAQGTEDDNSFDFLWHSEVKRFDGGYVVEASIPLQNLQIPDAEDGRLSMGFLPFRLQPRNFNHRFSPVEWDFDRSCFLCQIPQIRIENPDPGTTPVQFIPYASGLSEGRGSGTDITDHPADHTGSVGLDVKYQTSNSVIDATIFPDFSQVETDAFQMTSNVRFLPIVQERRPFFMERTDLFRFPISATLYTRSIVDPTAGARWTGKTGQHNWAVISMHDRAGWFIDPGPQRSRLMVDEEISSWNNLFRYRYDFSSDFMMGGFYSDRITEDGHNRLLSYDAQIGVGSNHTFVFQPLAAWNRYPERFSEEYGVSSASTFDYGYLIRMARSGRSWNYRAETRRYGKDLITGTGILQQTDVQRVTVWSYYDFWLDSRYFERIRPQFSTTGYWQLHGGDLRSLAGDPDLLTFSHQKSVDLFAINRTRLQLAGDYDYEYVEDFSGNGMESRAFDLFGFSASFSTDVSADYRFRVSGSYGSAVDYRLIERMEEYELSLSNSLYLFNRRVDLSHRMDFMQLSHDVVAQQAMTQRLSAELQLTRSFAVRNIMQYRDFRFKEPRYGDSVPNRIRTLQNQMLFRYRINYAAAIYLGGFAELGEQAPRLRHELPQEQSQWQVFAKISWLL